MSRIRALATMVTVVALLFNPEPIAAGTPATCRGTKVGAIVRPLIAYTFQTYCPFAGPNPSRVSIVGTARGVPGNVGVWATLWEFTENSNGTLVLECEASETDPLAAGNDGEVSCAAEGTWTEGGDFICNAQGQTLATAICEVEPLE